MKSSKKNIEEGSITVFLSLLLPILLALIGTLLEAARLPSARTVISSGTRQAMQMMFSDYNKELWEDYHLFAYTETEEEALKEIQRGIQAFSMQEEKSSLDLWHIKLMDLSVEEKEVLTDEDGDILKHEAVEYMKYQAPKEFADVLKQLFSTLKQTGSSAKIVKEKLAAEGEMYQYSEKMLEFMELVEGIDFGKEGVQYQGNLLKIKSVFVKQFLYQDASKTFLGINNDVVWDSLKNTYFQAGEVLDDLSSLLKKTESELRSIEQEKARIELLSEQISSLQQQKEALKQSIKEEESKPKEESQKEGYKKELSAIEKSIRQSRKEQREIQNGMGNAEKIKQQLSSSWEKETKKLKEKAREIRSCIKKASALIPELKEQQKEAARAVEKYRTALKEQEGSISGEMKKAFSEDCDELSASVGIRPDGSKTKQPVYDLELFGRYLTDNDSILQSVEAITGISDITIDSVLQKEKEIAALAAQIKRYHISEFAFSYNITKKKKDVQNPMEALKKLGNTTLLSLVMKNEKEISGAELGSAEHVFSEKQENNGFHFGGNELPDFSTENNSLFSDIFGKFFTNFNDSGISFDFVSDTAQSVLQELLLNAYVQTSFFNAQTEKENKKVSVLKYEQEYVLFGNEKDKDNLAAFIKDLSVVRMICNYLSLLSDPVRQKEAEAAAAAIAGVTGLAPLIKVIKSAILLVWAYEEGIVDIAALLQGKKIPLIKEPSQLMLSFSELLAFGRALVQKKAGSIKDSKAGIFYSQYLYIFLCLRKQKTVIYRMADMIQFNMKKRYQENFLLNQAIFGCKVKGSYYLPSVFFKFPFVEQISGETITGWDVDVLEEMAY